MKHSRVPSGCDIQLRKQSCDAFLEILGGGDEQGMRSRVARHLVRIAQNRFNDTGQTIHIGVFESLDLGDHLAGSGPFHLLRPGLVAVHHVSSV